MNLLLTNDDGYSAEGLRVLADSLKNEGYNVFIIAPDKNRSAISHSVSVFRGLTLHKMVEQEWTCSGVPVDCVVAGVGCNLIDVKIDAVVSGINCGHNLGTDIIYSGTCGAARQAIIEGYPGIALSLFVTDHKIAQKEGYKYKALADFAAKNIEKLIALAALEEPRMFVNVNGLNADSYKGVKFAEKISRIIKHDRIDVVEVKASDGKETDEIKLVYTAGEDEPVSDEYTDFSICRDGYITISKVSVDPLSGYEKSLSW